MSTENANTTGLAAVAASFGRDLDENLAGLGSFELHRLDGEGFAGLPGHCRANVHVFAIPTMICRSVAYI